MPPRCMNTVCCCLPRIIQVCPGITGSMTPEGWEALGGRESPGASREQGRDGCSKSTSTPKKTSLWVKFTVQWSPVHLAADGRSVLDLAIPLEKTPSVMVLSVLFSTCSECSDITKTRNQNRRVPAIFGKEQELLFTLL